MSHLRRLFAVVALALVIAPLVASAPLFDPDEGLHAAIAQEMVQRGDYVTPTFRGEPFLDKPILFFWAEAASLGLFGDNPFAVRVPPLLFGLLGMIGVALLGRALFDESTGLVSGIVYGTMLLPLGVSEVAVHDVGLVPFMCIACVCLLKSEQNLGRYAVVAGVALGLSILTKGLVGIVFTGIFAFCLAVRRPSSILRLAAFLTIAVVVALLVAAPWYIAMERAHPGYLHYYFVERHLQGYLTATQRHAGRPFWYYLPIVVAGTLPWTAYLAAGLHSAWRGDAPPEPWRRRALWGWFAIGLVFLSIGESKLVTYALPLFPILALIVGKYVTRVVLPAPHESRSFPVPWPERAPASRRQAEGHWFRLAFWIHAIALAFIPLAGLILLKVKFDEAPRLLWAIVIVLGLEILRSAFIAMRRRFEGAPVDVVVRMSVIALIGMMLVAPRAAAWMTSRDLAATLNSAGTLPPRVWVIDERIGSLIFYLDPPLRAQATADRVNVASFPDVMNRLRVDPPDTVFAVRNSQLPRFNRMFPSPPPPDARAGTFTLFRADTLRTTQR